MTPYQDYLIVLSPSESVTNKVKNLKEFSHDKIGGFDSRYSKAHITIQSWPRKRPVWIEPLIPKLERDLQGLPPVILDINGFGVFDQQETKTIYARLTSTPQTKVWFKFLRKFFSTPPFEPHITIARSVPIDDFKKLWSHFKNHQWEEQFVVDKLTILRRETIGHDKSYKLFKEIPFNTRMDFYDFTNLKLKTPVLPINKVNALQTSLF